MQYLGENFQATGLKLALSPREPRKIENSAAVDVVGGEHIKSTVFSVLKSDAALSSTKANAGLEHQKISKKNM